MQQPCLRGQQGALAAGERGRGADSGCCGKRPDRLAATEQNPAEIVQAGPVKIQGSGRVVAFQPLLTIAEGAGEFAIAAALAEAPVSELVAELSAKAGGDLGGEPVENPLQRGRAQRIPAGGQLEKGADGGLLATKPYVSSAAYVHRMSDYCQQCHYQRAQRTGARACPFNALYWDFHLRHRDRLEGNPRIGMAYRNLQKMDTQTREALVEQANAIRRRLDQL